LMLPMCRGVRFSFARDRRQRTMRLQRGRR
jgi:hypothetical protein